MQVVNTHKDTPLHTLTLKRRQMISAKACDKAASEGVRRGSVCVCVCVYVCVTEFVLGVNECICVRVHI